MKIDLGLVGLALLGVVGFFLLRNVKTSGISASTPVYSGLGRQSKAVVQVSAVTPAPVPETIPGGKFPGDRPVPIA